MNALTPAQVAIRDAVVRRYLDDCTLSSVADIAKLVRRSESWVRRVLGENSGNQERGLINIEGLSWHRDERATYGKSSPGVPTGTSLVRVYVPATWYLRELLLTERLATRNLESARYREKPPVEFESILTDLREGGKL